MNKKERDEKRQSCVGIPDIERVFDLCDIQEAHLTIAIEAIEHVVRQTENSPMLTDGAIYRCRKVLETLQNYTSKAETK